MKMFKEFLMPEDGFKVKAMLSDDNLVWFDVYELNLIKTLNPLIEQKPIVKATIEWDAKNKKLCDLHLEPMNGILITNRDDVDRWSSLMFNLYKIADELTEVAEGLSS